MALIEWVAALTPRPRINLVLYHGVLAPHARWRARVVAHRPGPAATSLPASLSGDDTTAKPTLRHWAWAKLMQRAFAHPIDCMPRRRGDRACPGHTSVSSALRAGDRLCRTAAQLG